MTPSSTRSASRGKPARVSDGMAPTATAPWASADIEADILAEASRPGVGEPVTIHVRPAVYARVRAATQSACRQDGRRQGAAGIPFVIDDRIPSAPGYEIHRAVPEGPACSI